MNTHSNQKKKRKNSIDALFEDDENEVAVAPAHKKISITNTSTASSNQGIIEEGAQLQRRKSELAPLRKDLPVYQFQSKIVSKLLQTDVLLVSAETGSGKSTQIPAYLDESGKFRQRRKSSNHKSNSLIATSICVTQPRRVAAMTVAQRVAEERGCRLGTAVGYKVRFDDMTTPQTRIIYATDGMLLRECMADPLLTRYAVVVLDEMHTRSLSSDILMGCVQRAMRARNQQQEQSSSKNDDYSSSSSSSDDEKDQATKSIDQRIQQRMRQRAQEWGIPPLKVVVMSATLELDTFVKFFSKSERIQIPGRMYPVQIVYTKEPQEDYCEYCVGRKSCASDS